MDSKVKAERKKNPREGANFLSVVTFAWMLKILWNGYKRGFEVEDLCRPLKEHKGSIVGDKLAIAWKNEQIRIDKINNKLNKSKNSIDITKQKTPSLKRALLAAFGTKIIISSFVLLLIETVVKIFQPLALGRLLRYFSTDNIPKTEAYLYACGIILCSAVNVFITNAYFMNISHAGMKMRVACCSLIYRKALRLSKTSLAKMTIGQAMNVLSNDVGRFDVSLTLIPYTIIGPLQTIIITYIMYQEIGLPAIYGVVILLVYIPFQSWFGKKSSTFRLRTANRTDERIHLTNEIIRGIQVIKMYTWEYLFSGLIENSREQEIGAIRYMSYVRSCLISFVMFTTRCCLFVTIVPYVLSNEVISTEKVFILTAFYTTLQQSMAIFFPYAISFYAELLVTIKRLQEFMTYDEIELAMSKKSDNNDEANSKNSKTVIYNIENDRELEIDNINDGNKSLTLDNVNVKWIESSHDDTLHGINIKIEPGQLVVIVGQVGSGKSSLLNVILKELPLSHGKMSAPNKIAYASQEPWLFSSSICQNIIFGRPMDIRKYNEVIKVCQLEHDFTLLPYGDKTIVGERGVALSGGQRARINLARAVYVDASLYLFDDPLSAVDAQVGKNIFDECINNYLRGRTRILVTHQIQFLRNVDKIIVLNNGSVEAEGTYEQLTSIGINFGNTLEQNGIEKKLSDSNSTNEFLMRRDSQRSYVSRDNVIPIDSAITNDATQQNVNDLEEVEELERLGNVNVNVYTSYLKAVGNRCAIFGIILLFIAAQASGSGVDWFLAYWMKVEDDTKIKLNTSESIINNVTSTSSTFDAKLSRNSCIYILSSLIFITIILSIIRSMSFFEACLRASIQIHNSMFRTVIHATMYFFNTNTSGRILSRFTKDVGAIDEILPVTFMNTLYLATADLSIIFIITLSNPWLFIPTVIIAIIFYIFLIIYSSTNRSVKRLESITRSPIYTHFNASLQGLTTIRSFNAEKILIDEFDRHQDFHSAVWYIFIGMAQGFGFWLDFICVIYIFFVTMSFLVFQSDTNSSQSSDVGLAVTQSIGLIGMLQWLVKQNADLESQMTSMERAIEYMNIESEPPLDSLSDKKPPANWPYAGKIEFKEIFLSYGPMKPHVLRDLNFTIESRERIGIVGRTGAGKSSLISVLFRLANVEGIVEIDNVDIQNIGLHDLRSNISIIPQTPFLFSGTLRKNLDPFDQYDDKILWSALEEVELKDMELNGHVNDDGSNFSIGQRQLICLARVIIKRNKILILDEATANVDLNTDEFIQKTIKNKFSDCTVLTIAHRLNTIMDSDKILVMDAGTAVEFNHPHLLLQNKDSFFSKMVQETGADMAEELAKIAKENYTNRRLL